MAKGHPSKEAIEKFKATMAARRRAGIKRSMRPEDPAPQFLVKDNIVYRKVTMPEIVEIFQEWLKHHG
jgi:hypothetical protein